MVSDSPMITTLVKTSMNAERRLAVVLKSARIPSGDIRVTVDKAFSWLRIITRAKIFATLGSTTVRKCVRVQIVAGGSTARAAMVSSY